MIVYTVITNDYDTLKEPTVVTPGWEYICFSDVERRSDIWDCGITEKTQREVKIMGWHELGEQPALYIDGSIEITGNLDNFMRAIRGDFSLWKHPDRDCIFEEADAVVKLRGQDRNRVDEQMKRYEAIPRHWGLGQTGIMFRDFGVEWVRALSYMWYQEVRQGVSRDQLSLSYLSWLMGKRPFLIPEAVIRKHFKMYRHAKEFYL